MTLRVSGKSIADGTYDGSFPVTTLSLLKDIEAPALIRNVQRYNLPYSAAKAKATEITS